MPKEPDYQTLESKLYIENTGQIEIHFSNHKSGFTQVEAKVWDINLHQFLWRGTPIEFWALILAGIEATAPKPCPKCGQMEGHQELCPIKLLAKKEE